MRILQLLTCAVCCVQLYGQNVIDVMEDLGLTKFVQYLNASGVSDEWANIPSINVFAPTDGALESAEDAGLLPSDFEELRDLLIYHAVSGSLGSLTTDKFQNDALLESTHTNNYIRFNVYDNPDGIIYTTTGSKVDMMKANNNASNGVVQVIVSVMIPPTFTINEMVQQYGNFSQIARAINLANLDTILQGEGNFTLFAPTDAAFAKLSQEDVDALFNDTNAVTDLVNYHLVPSTYYSEGIYDGLTLTTMQGGQLMVSIMGDPLPGPVLNGEARITYTNLLNTNGVVNVIDTVLTVPQTSGTSSSVAKDEWMILLILISMLGIAT